jgi:hypothetical protein
MPNLTSLSDGKNHYVSWVGSFSVPFVQRGLWLLSQQVMQFACAQPGLVQPNSGHVLNDVSGLSFFPALTLQ